MGSALPVNGSCEDSPATLGDGVFEKLSPCTEGLTEPDGEGDGDGDPDGDGDDGGEVVTVTGGVVPVSGGGGGGAAPLAASAACAFMAMT